MGQNSRVSGKFLWPSSEDQKGYVFIQTIGEIAEKASGQDSFERCWWPWSIPLPFFVALYQWWCFDAACISCWDWTKRRKPCAWGNHHLLLVVCEWSITAGLRCVVNIPFVKAVFSHVQILKTSENQHDTEKYFLEHIFKVRSFYFIYFIFLCSVNGLFSFSSAFIMVIILWNCNTIYSSVKICLLLVESKDHQTLNSIFKMSV